MNVPRAVAIIVSSGHASLTELSTTLGLEDLHDLMEIVVIDSHNDRVINTPKG